MIKKSCLVLSCVLFLNALAFGQFGQQRQRVEYSIRGKLMLDTGQDVEQRIEVRLEGSTSQLITSTYTDSIGNFEFRNIQPGAYYIAVNGDGYQPTRQQVEVFGTGGGVTNVTMFVERASSDRPGARRAVDAADPDIIDVSQLKENFPKKAVQNYDKATEEIKKGRDANAIKLLEEAVQIAPKFFRAHIDLGLLYQKAKRFEDAERLYKRSQEISPKNVQPLVNLGSLYIQESDVHQKEGREVVGKYLDQALDTLETAVKMNPNSSVAYYYLGSANFKSQFLEEAEAAFKKVEQLDPEMSLSRLMLANVYAMMNRLDDAVRYLDLFLKENPKAENRAALEDLRARLAKGLETSNQ
jgi:tetratricopeptide (TPR) repeat protein